MGSTGAAWGAQARHSRFTGRCGQCESPALQHCRPRADALGDRSRSTPSRSHPVTPGQGWAQPEPGVEGVGGRGGGRRTRLAWEGWAAEELGRGAPVREKGSSNRQRQGQGHREGCGELPLTATSSAPSSWRSEPPAQLSLGTASRAAAARSLTSTCASRSFDPRSSPSRAM